jgi:DNA-directed RNA polymerase specialized sigma24 family protein
VAFAGPRLAPPWPNWPHIVLRYFEGKSLAEICEITNKREGTVKSLLHRALAQLKNALVRAGLTLP